jgi:hypothetical protein
MLEKWPRYSIVVILIRQPTEKNPFQFAKKLRRPFVQGTDSELALKESKG